MEYTLMINALTIEIEFALENNRLNNHSLTIDSKNINTLRIQMLCYLFSILFYLLR